MPLRQFLNSGAKQLIFHPWDLYPRGKLKQILTFEVVSPIPVVSPGAVVTVAAEQHRTRCRLELFSSTGGFLVADNIVLRLGPTLKCCCWMVVKPRSHLSKPGQNRRCKSRDMRNVKCNLSGFVCRCLEPDRH